MHAVVILYDYYHRRQFPKLKALGFESFCKISCIAQPGLSAYMRHVVVSKEDLADLNNQFSITEKMIEDACNTCIRLDPSKDTPNIEAWPISKVAVFLVDPTKEKCMLQFSSVTQGVWSLVEQTLEAGSEKAGKGYKSNTFSSQKVNFNRSSRTKCYQQEKVLEQLAFSAVQQLTGEQRQPSIFQ